MERVDSIWTDIENIRKGETFVGYMIPAHLNCSVANSLYSLGVIPKLFISLDDIEQNVNICNSFFISAEIIRPSYHDEIIKVFDKAENLNIPLVILQLELKIIM